MNHEIISETLLNSLNNEIAPFDLHDKKTYETIAEKIGNARIVLMGEATHGTQEFYEARIGLSQYLIQEKGFHAIAIEGDWTSTYPVNQYLRGVGKNDDINSILSEFKHFPRWMWRNTTIPPFLNWLRNYNDSQSNEHKIGFYGLDLYCLNDAMHTVINYLMSHDPAAAKQAIHRYACFDHTTVDPQQYGYLTNANIKKACIEEASEQVRDMQRLAFEKFHTQPTSDAELLFYATQNARLVKNAEHYYRALFEAREITWNIRDEHMAETLQNLIAHLETQRDIPAKVIVWAHNSHVGDARATEMSTRNEINLGQLVRELYGSISFHLGFSTYTGTVTAASDWDGKAETKNVLPGMQGSYEALFHLLKYPNFILDLHQGEYINHLLQLSRLQRAIGVIYRPESERYSHYFFTHLPYQFDAIVHIDKTTAVTPIDNN